MKPLVPAFILALSLISCQSETPRNRVKAVVQAISFPDTLSVGQSGSVTVTYHGTNGCSQQDGLDLTNLSRQTIITPYYTHPAGNAACDEILPIFTESFTITPTLTGPYFLTAHDGGIFDSVIVVP